MVFSRKVLTISLVVIIAAAVALVFIFKGKPDVSESKAAQESSGEARKVEEEALPVRVAQARIGDLVIKLRSPGEAVTNKKIAMAAEVAGVIKRLNIEESEHVEKGEVLVELEDEEYRLALERAEADRLKVLSELLVEKQFSGPEKALSTSDQRETQKAKDDYEKARKLYRSGQLSKEEFEKASKEFELALIEAGEKKDEILAATKGLTQAEIRVREAQMSLEKTKIRAPFSGIVCEIKVTPHEFVTASKEIFILVDISQIQVHAKVLESEISKMRVGQEADLRFSAYPKKVFKGRVKAISPIINPEDKTCNVVIDTANPGEEIRPGMHAEVEIAAEIHKNRLLVPQQAVLVRQGRKLVFVIEEGLAKWRYIDVGLENEEYAEALDGVKQGELVAIDGQYTLAHDARVRIEN